MANELERRYRFFRTYAGGVVGRSAQVAIDLARAELAAESMGWTYTLEPEIERYEDVYGEAPPEGVEYYTVVARDEDGDWIASLGFVDDVDQRYFRVVAAELYSEALATVRRPGVYPMSCEAVLS